MTSGDAHPETRRMMEDRYPTIKRLGVCDPGCCDGACAARGGSRGVDGREFDRCPVQAHVGPFVRFSSSSFPAG